jgi:hypothetical protein
MIILDNEPDALDLQRRKCKLSELVFRHQRPHQLEVIRPQTIAQVQKYRSEDMSSSDLKTYMDDRINSENYYSNLINKPKEMSFTYASIVGFNKMEDPTKYPGFTYFFKITPKKLDETIFELVSGKDELDIMPATGLNALEQCMKQWIAHHEEFSGHADNILGWIDPRIEVVISYDIIPFAMIPEVEQR